MTEITHSELTKIVKKVLQLVTQFISKLVAHFFAFSFELKNVFLFALAPTTAFLRP